MEELNQNCPGVEVHKISKQRIAQHLTFTRDKRECHCLSRNSRYRSTSSILESTYFWRCWKKQAFRCGCKFIPIFNVNHLQRWASPLQLADRRSRSDQNSAKRASATRVNQWCKKAESGQQHGIIVVDNQQCKNMIKLIFSHLQLHVRAEWQRLGNSDILLTTK